MQARKHQNCHQVQTQRQMCLVFQNCTFIIVIRQRLLFILLRAVSDRKKKLLVSKPGERNKLLYNSSLARRIATLCAKSFMRRTL